MDVSLFEIIRTEGVGGFESMFSVVGDFKSII
jgi:hypothetical protein